MRFTDCYWTICRQPVILKIQNRLSNTHKSMFSHYKRHHKRRDGLLMNKHGPRINQTIFLKKKRTKETVICPTQFVYTLPRKHNCDLIANAKFEFSYEKFYFTKWVNFRVRNQLSKNFDRC